MSAGTKGTEQEGGPTGASADLDAEHPWPGLRPFDEADSAYFFGREAETQQLKELVERAPVVVLYGQSGLGKTSLLRAGLFPALKSALVQPVWVRLDWTPEAPPPTVQLLRTLVQALTAAQVEAPAPAPDDSLWSYFHRVDADFWGARNRLVKPLIVLDQFEEIFTLGQRDTATAMRAEAFVRELEAQFEQRPPAAVRKRLEAHPEAAAEYDLTRDNVRFLVSLREDYLPHLDAWREQLPSMLARRYRLEPMTTAQALQVVQRAGAHLVDEAVAGDIVDFVAEGGADRRVEPAILGVVCNELNLRRLQAGQPRITRELLSGERSRIIEDFYQRSFEGVSESTRDWIEDELLTAGGHRDRAALEDARKAGVDLAELESLVQRRVLHSDERQRVQWLEFSHDLLTAPAMASRTARQQRLTEIHAREREAEVRRKLRRSRWFALVLALSTLSSVSMLFEARRQHANAKTAQFKADQRASEATAASVRASEAESIAQSNLQQARQTALTTAEQAVRRLQVQWITPSLDGAAVVRTNLANMEPLIQQFSDDPALRVARKRLLSLGALIHAQRGEESACAELAGQALSIETRLPGEAEQLASATSLLANAQCLRMRGEYAEADRHFKASAEVALRLPAGTADRARLLVAAHLGEIWVALARFRYDEIQAPLAAAEAALPPGPLPGLELGELQAMRFEVVDQRVSLMPEPARRLRERERVEKILSDVSAEVSETIGWQFRRLALRFDRASDLQSMGRQADADDMAQQLQDDLDKLLATDPRNIALQLVRVRTLRMRAEILYGWKRSEAATKLLTDIQSSVEGILKTEKRLASARFYQAVSAWLYGTYSADRNDAKRRQFRRAYGQLTQQLKDNPDHAEAQRTLAIADKELGRLDAVDGEAEARPAAARTTLKRTAQAHFRAALRRMAGFPRSARGEAFIADLEGNLEMDLGDLLLGQGENGPALEAFRRGALAYRRVPVTADNESERTVTALYADNRVARALRRLGRWDEADASDADALRRLRAVRKHDPRNFQLLDNEAWVYRMAAGDQLQANRLSEAVHSQIKAAELLNDAFKADVLSREIEEALDNVLSYIDRWIKPKVAAANDEALSRLVADARRLQASATVQARAIQHSNIPLTAGSWEHFDVKRHGPEEFGLKDEAAKLQADGWTIASVRRLSLPFYDRAQLIEMDVQAEKRPPGIATFVVEPGAAPMRLTGADYLRNLNIRQNLTLSTPLQAASYLRFYLIVLNAEEGRFRPIEQYSDLQWLPDAPAKEREQLARQIQPLEFQREPDGYWTAQGTMQYGVEAYLAKFKVARDGVVSIAHDRMISASMMLATERYERGLRVRDEMPARLTPLLAEGKAAIARKDWPAAATALQTETRLRSARSACNRNTTRFLDALVALSWYGSLVGQPEAALKAADDALACDPAASTTQPRLSLLMNRAHALLALGRGDEALAIYREHIGKPMSTNNPTLWEREVLSDLKALDEAGQPTEPRFAAVRQMMDEAVKSRKEPDQ